MLSWGIWAPPNGPKKVHKGLQVGGMYVSMCKLENEPPNQIIKPIFVGKIGQNNQKISSLCCFGASGQPQMEPKRYPKARKRAGCKSQHLSLKIIP
jgi:hypothetical protein